MIVGQGIAGTLLSYQLQKRNKSFIVVDKGHHNACSSASSGIINPITGRRFKVAWMFEDLRQKAISIYGELERFLEIDILRSRPLVKVFYTEEESKRWKRKRTNAEFASLIGKVEKPFSDFDLLNNAIGTAQINSSLQIDIVNLIGSYRAWLMDNKRLKVGSFSLDGISYTGSGYSWSDIEFEKLVFCGGAADRENSLFQDLPFKLSKGQAFVAEIKRDLNDFIIKGEVFVVPLPENELYWIGTHNNWEFDHSDPDSNAREILEKKLRNTLNLDFNIREQVAGIRPATSDRKPFLGRHSQLTHVYIFNGLGTKGASWAPYWSEKMADYLIIDDASLLAEVDIARFKS